MAPYDSGIRALAPEACVLADDVPLHAVADTCRSALLVLMGGHDWSKVELAAWLAGPYREVTRHATKSREHEGGAQTIRPPSHVLRRIVRVDAVEELLAATRERVRATLHTSTLPQSEIAAAVYSGFVERARDASASQGWVPVDWPAMGLYDRVMSLVVCDYLMRPADYLGLLGMCRVCGALSFDAECRARDVCRLHMPEPRRAAGR
jgi:hypothetical protein